MAGTRQAEEGVRPRWRDFFSSVRRVLHHLLHRSEPGEGLSAPWVSLLSAPSPALPDSRPGTFYLFIFSNCSALNALDVY